MSVASFLIMLLIPPFIALVHDSFSVSYCSSQMGTQQISYHYWMTFLPFIFFYASKGMTMHCIWELPILLPETFKVLSNCTIWISAPAPHYYIGASKRHCLNSQNEDWVQFFFFVPFNLSKTSANQASDLFCKFLDWPKSHCSWLWSLLLHCVHTVEANVL